MSLPSHAFGPHVGTAATTAYYAPGKFVSLPFIITKGGRLADCWHVGGINHACFARFDVGGVPRVLRVHTPVVESGAALRLGGLGIDGGLNGREKLAATLFRGACATSAAHGVRPAGSLRLPC